jgi:pimeloyl-ACP methyl ester carboxylesterase
MTGQFRSAVRTRAVAAVFGFIACSPQFAGGQEDHTYDFREIQGNRIAWSCEGTGRPTIVLVAGSGSTAHESFGRAYHNYGGPGRICMYDRAGIGESVFDQPKARNLAELVNELHLLNIEEQWRPVVLVAHSFGGFIARAYAAQHASDVLGILFLDVVHEDWLPRLKADMSANDWAIMDKTVSWTLTTLHEDYYEAQEAVRKLTLASDLPITVVSRGLPHTTIRVAGMSYDGVDFFNAEHNALPAKLIALSSDAEHRVARYSSHMIDDTDPWLVIEEIGKLVERVTSQREPESD